MIKSCKNYNLSDKESLETINKILDKEISRRTYYNYKKKLYDKVIINQLKGSIYDHHMMRYLLLNLEETDWKDSAKADFLVTRQLPDRKDIFHDTDLQKPAFDRFEITKTKIAKLEYQLNEPLQRYKTVPKNAIVREEFVKCGKENCNDCAHGPYYYAYWKDIATKKLKKKYLGVIDPRQ